MRRANVRSAVPAVETYFADNGTYVGMNAAALTAIRRLINRARTLYRWPTRPTTRRLR